jgi:hypothetical protein
MFSSFSACLSEVADSSWLALESAVSVGRLYSGSV